MSECGNLARFVGALLDIRAVYGGDIDGYELEEKLKEHGLLEIVEADGPCGDVCNCNEFGGDWPMDCLRPSELGRKCLAAFDRWSKGNEDA